MEAQGAQDEHDNDDQADKVNDAVHGLTSLVPLDCSRSDDQRTARLKVPLDPKKVGEHCGSSTSLRTGIGTMTFATWVLIGLIGGWVAHNAAEYSNGLLSHLLLGVLSACLGAYVLSQLLGLRLASGLAFVPTLLAVVSAGAGLGLSAFLNPGPPQE